MSRSKSLPTVVIDTREQTPYSFSKGIHAIRKALPTGDYSLLGLEDVIAIERKSLDDFVSTLIHHRRRFAAELRRLSEMRVSAVIVEADIEDVLARRYRQEAHPNAVLGAANAIFLKYGVPIFFWGTRETCRFMLENLLNNLWKQTR